MTMMNCDVVNTQITNCQMDGFEHPKTEFGEAACATGQISDETNNMNIS